MTVTGAVPVPVPMSLPMPAPRVASLLDGPTVRLPGRFSGRPTGGTAAGPRAVDRPGRSALTIAVDVVGRAGTVVTLAAALVVGGAVGGLTDGAAPTGAAGAVGHATLGGR